MVRLWRQEAVSWRVELEKNGMKALEQRVGDQHRQLILGLGAGEVTAELLRRAAAKAVKTVRGFGGTTLYEPCRGLAHGT